LSKTRIVWG